ncbi:uncharacterized protein LOC106074759 isoform X2 [Biomphalaria glabrata]|uniref:Uncharacterized protein LOC106074759 isoform X2 n=1 Tax=Biomphalaria glabrata TaxID=6526 RepID=A0A9W3BCF3_BIOGL|nr:uncharacterized protein LOC106074759 isoform X2 [Biomphalaria glabrata]
MFKRASVSFINKSKYAQILHSQVAEKVSIGLLNCQRNFRFSRPTTSFGIKDSSKKWIIITGVGLAIISSGLKIKRLKAGDSGREENAGRRFYEETDEHDESLGEKDSEPLITETKINEIVLIDEVQTFCSNGTGILNVYHFHPVMNHRTTVREISPQPEDLQKNAIFPGKKEDQAIIKRITKEQYEKCTEDFSRSQIDDPKKFVFNNEQGTPLAISKIMHDAKPVKSPTKTLHQYEKPCVL